MKAVIPAAGEGKRFNKDSTYMHKCLVPINGKALLLYTLENLTNIKEITECIVIIGENHEKIIDTIAGAVYLVVAVFGGAFVYLTATWNNDWASG